MNSYLMINRSTFLTLFGISLMVSATQAATISWGGAFSSTNHAADGSALETGTGPSDVFFELGIFAKEDGSAFIPTTQNAEEWEARWVPFHRNDRLAGSATSRPSFSEFQPATGFFGSNAEVGDRDHQTDNSIIPAGRQAFIWGYDSKSYTPGMTDAPEWLLFTGSAGGSTPSDTNWIVPDQAQGGNDSFPLVWEVTTADTAVFGRIPTSTGGGEMTDPGVPLSLDDTQFASVPEPSSSLLIALGLVCCATFRNRNFGRG